MSPQRSKRLQSLSDAAKYFGRQLLPPLPIGVERILYHATSYSVWEKVQREGLVPGRARLIETRTATGLIFLSTEADIGARIIRSLVEEEQLPPGRYVILEVKVPACVFLYPDPFLQISLVPVSFVTDTSIHPINISLFREFTVGLR